MAVCASPGSGIHPPRPPALHEIASVASSEETYNERTGYYETDIDWTGYIVGTAIGVALVALGIVKIVRSQREINRLQRLRLSYAPELGNGGVRLAFDF